jgi:hypothetical protein
VQCSVFAWDVHRSRFVHLSFWLEWGNVPSGRVHQRMHEWGLMHSTRHVLLPNNVEWVDLCHSIVQLGML